MLGHAAGGEEDISNAGGEVVSGVCAIFVRNYVAIEVASFGGYANSKSLF